MHDGDLGPQGAEEVGQLGGDVPSAQDDEPPGLPGQAEGLVRGDKGDIRKTIDVRDARPAPGGDDDAFCGDSLAAHLQDSVADKPAGVLEDAYLRVSAVTFLNGLSVAVHAIYGPPDDRTPVHSGHLGGDAKQPGALDRLHDVGAVDEHLGGDAAAVQARAAEGAVLDHRDGEPAGGRFRGDLETGTRTDDYQVK